MKNVWRFYDGRCSGIVIADDLTQAKERTIAYLNGYFSEDEPVEETQVQVWRAEADDDFVEEFPHALAVCY